MDDEVGRGDIDVIAFAGENEVGRGDIIDGDTVGTPSTELSLDVGADFARQSSIDIEANL